MRIAFATTFDANDIHHWSGTPYHMARALTHEGTNIDYIGSLVRKLPAFFKTKQFLKKYIANQRESPRFNVVAATHYSKQVASQLSHLTVDAVLSPLINPIAYLECRAPIVLWTDAVYAALVGFYPAFAYHSAQSIVQGNQITAACLARCSLAIFSSEWAARSAIEFYGVERNKVKVVPYGANIESYPSPQEIREIIKQRETNKINLLFFAKSWERKGGDIALAIAKTLYEAGESVLLNIVGYTPQLETIPPYINCLGFISKQTFEGREKIKELLLSSHFLVLPSRADACPMVFAEANAFALPCLTSHVGGIATAIKDNINGMTFALDAPPSYYCQYIIDTIKNYSRYQSLALSAYHEYETRLNWRVAVREVKSLINSL